VTVDPRPAATPTVAELDRLLLDAKVSAPQLRKGSVSRAKLIETGRASFRRVVAVTAPAGYGKSTLLAEWAEAEDRAVAWVSLDRFDDDPAILLTLLASAYARIASGNGGLISEVGVSACRRWAAPRRVWLRCSAPVRFRLFSYLTTFTNCSRQPVTMC
jgi:LuxR family transcriptional regulator, maltose regulon positive regulatory protein